MVGEFSSFIFLPHLPLPFAPCGVTFGQEYSSMGIYWIAPKHLDLRPLFLRLAYHAFAKTF